MVCGGEAHGFGWFCHRFSVSLPTFSTAIYAAYAVSSHFLHHSRPTSSTSTVVTVTIC
ncbi:hypothetical protein M8C21_009293 [Ambrosia artemisiifolia]|uniref:Uncharacterized protein n=1 Tax=Ambrosia artemisiifolia TaxID=4212 RepID=A0AAD5CW71_AMBAR|nr:hypothetical protein M8C21_009293 [Ambrosia artemisiifolia]